MTSRYTGRTATYIGVLNLAAKIVERLAAFAQIAVIASIFGATTKSDLYFVASIVPLLIGTIGGEALATSVLPSLVRRTSREDAAVHLAATFWAALAALLAIWAGYLAVTAVVVGQFAPAGTTSLLPWLAFSPTIVTLGLTSFLGAVLLYEERYTWPPFRAALATSAGLVFIAASLPFAHSITLVALGTSGGYTVALLLLGLDVRRAYGHSWLRPPKRPDLRAALALGPNAILALGGGVVGGQSFVLIERFLAAGLGVGAVSTISYARGLVFAPNIIGQAVAMGIYPGMVRAHEAGDRAFVRNALLRGLRLTILTSLAIAIFITVFSSDIVRILLQRGAFGAAEAHGVTTSVIAFTPGVVGTMLLVLSSRALYAINYFRGVLWSQLGVLVLYVPLALVLRTWLGANGLALAFGLAELAGGIGGIALSLKLLGAVPSDVAALKAVVSPLVLVTVASLLIRLAFDRLALGGVSGAAAAAGVGGLAVVLIVLLQLLLSDWPESRVLRHRFEILRSRVTGA